MDIENRLSVLLGECTPFDSAGNYDYGKAVQEKCTYATILPHGNLVETLWDIFEPDAHFNGYRLALYHPNNGLLITEDVEWFFVRRVAFIPVTDRQQLLSTIPLSSSEMLFHVSGHEIWRPFQISHTFAESHTVNQVGLPLPPHSMLQTAMAAYADRWA